MAANKCISRLIEVERCAHHMVNFCELVDEVAGDESPAWLVHLWAMVKELEAHLAELGQAVRDQS